MEGLQHIRHSVQNVAEAITSSLNLDVEIIDNNLIVVAATGRIRNRIGLREDTAHVTRQILKVGTSFTIDSPGEHELCIHCKLENRCFYTAALICPINMNGQILGTLSLASFSDQQREKLLSLQGQYLDFLSRMAELIAGQVQLHEALKEVTHKEKYLNTVVNSVSEGIVAVDTLGNISFFNQAADRFTGRNDSIDIGRPQQHYFPGSPLLEVLKTRNPVLQKELTCRKDSLTKKAACSAYPIMSGKQILGGVMVLKAGNHPSVSARNTQSRLEKITFDDIKGNSHTMKTLIEEAKVVAGGSSTVLIQGESGTGKELFARAIASASPYRDGPFQIINCSAIPEFLLESELFGYEEGAFTGARKGGKPGKFELADGGTLFLDEIGDMPLLLQSKLLRVLETNTLERVGGTEQHHFDVRIIAATNRHLEQMLGMNQFRKDLYYRLNVIPLFIPSLSERPEDIVSLAEYFLSKYSFL